jgi:hypothetical protein
MLKVMNNMASETTAGLGRLLPPNIPLLLLSCAGLDEIAVNCAAIICKENQGTVRARDSRFLQYLELSSS